MVARGVAKRGSSARNGTSKARARTGARLQGYALQGWFAPDITNDLRRGLGGWSIDDIATYLKTGHNKTSAGSGPMSETLNLSTSKMTDEDLKAIAIYLKDPPGQQQNRPATGSAALDQGVMKAGAQIYADECSGCHTSDGKGVPGLFPALSGAAVVQQTDPTTLLHVVLRGALSVGTDRGGDARLRLDLEGRPSCGRCHLYPQCLGQCRATRERRRRRQDARGSRRAQRLSRQAK
jgi:cytochrome c5